MEIDEQESAETVLTAVAKETDERRLVEAAQKDPARFADVYEATFDRVYAYVVARISDRDEAEDITSEVFHKALANLGKFEWRGIPVVAWLFRIASNAIVDRRKRAGREQGDPAPEPEASSEAADLDAAEHRAALYRLVVQLPKDQRRVIELRFGEEKSIREIAQAIGKGEGAVKQLQLRALQSLRSRIRETRG